MTEKFN